MKVVVSLLLLLEARASSYQSHVDTVVSAYLMDEAPGQEVVMARFQSWADLHDKDYADEDEAWKRMQIWLQNDALLEQHQTKPSSYELGHNQFSDMTLDEFHALHRLGNMRTELIPKMAIADQNEATKVSRSLQKVDLPDYVNWVQMGGVTPIKNQGACEYKPAFASSFSSTLHGIASNPIAVLVLGGACWAFSTTGALEGAKFVKTGELVALSEQNLLDCDHADMGCSGGLMDNAFKFDEKTGGLCSEEDYPYQAIQNDQCNTACTDVPGTIVKTFVDVPPGDERALLSALAMQPISVAIQADQFAFQFYRRGVLNDESCGKDAQIDHGVLAVGYGTDLDTQIPYWLVKNSWGEPVSTQYLLLCARDQLHFSDYADAVFLSVG